MLAPDNVGERANLTTSPPARTVSAPATQGVFDAAEPLASDPVSAAAELTNRQRQRLRAASALLGESHFAWRILGARSRLGIATFQFLMDA